MPLYLGKLIRAQKIVSQHSQSNPHLKKYDFRHSLEIPFVGNSSDASPHKSSAKPAKLIKF
jgi:hypothetical protein